MGARRRDIHQGEVQDHALVAQSERQDRQHQTS
jgi:hypothetical protein